MKRGLLTGVAIALAVASLSASNAANMKRALPGTVGFRNEIVQLAHNGDNKTVLAKVEWAWNHGYQNGQMARFAASVAGRAGDAEKACDWLFRIFKADRALKGNNFLGEILALNYPGSVDVEISEQEPLDYNFLMDDPSLVAVRKTPRFEEFMKEARAFLEKRDTQNGLHSGLKTATPSEVGLDPKRLEALVNGARDSHSSALIVIKNGKLIGEWYFGGWPRPIESMSCGKSFAAMAIGLLQSDGSIPSLDTPLWTYFPELRQGRKENLTIRNLLNHTSGIQATRDTAEIYRAPDFVQLALAAELVSDPGKKFSYNNKAVNLLPEIVKRACGEPMDELLGRRVFQPIGIKDFSFQHDDTGHIHGMSGLRIQPLDFAKIGLLMLNKGKFEGKHILSEQWVSEATQKPSSSLDSECGLLWWIAYKNMNVTLPVGFEKVLEKSGWTPDEIKKYGMLDGSTHSESDYYKALNSGGGGKMSLVWANRDAAGLSLTWKGEHPIGYYADGDLGNRLEVIPEENLVVVRMASSTGNVGDNIYFMQFWSLVSGLMAGSAK